MDEGKLGREADKNGRAGELIKMECALSFSPSPHLLSRSAAAVLMYSICIAFVSNEEMIVVGVNRHF